MREENVPVLQIYSEALIDAAQRMGTLDLAFEEAGVILSLLKKNPEVLRLLERPAIRKDEKKAFLRRVFEGRLSPLMLDLAQLLVDKNRGGLWMGLMEYFILAIERRRGIHTADIQTAHELSSAEKERLDDALERFLGKKLRIRFRVEPRLVGGVLFRYGDLMVDHTIRGHLRKMRSRLEAVKVARITETENE